MTNEFAADVIYTAKNGKRCKVYDVTETMVFYRDMRGDKCIGRLRGKTFEDFRAKLKKGE